MKIITFVFLMTALYTRDLYKVCTDDAKLMVDDVFAMVQALEANNFNPDHTPFKQFTASLEKFLRECAQVDVNVQDYNDCVENVLVVLPEVGHLVDSINRENTADIILDASRVAYGLVTGLTMCLRDKGYDPVLANLF